MAPRNAGDVAQKRRKSKSEKKTCKKVRIYKSALNFGPYLCKVLKRIHPKLSLSVRTINIMNSFGSDMVDRIAKEAACLAQYVGHKTITTSEIQSAVRLLFPQGLLEAATTCGFKAVVKYYQSKKGCVSRMMNEEEFDDSEKTYIKNYSKSQKLIYYWNTKTHESLWETDFQEQLKRPDIKIVDYTKDKKTDENIPGRQINTSTNLNSFLPSEPKSSHVDEFDDEDEDPDLQEALNAYHESCNSSSSIYSGSAGSCNKDELGFSLERSNSHTLSASENTNEENITSMGNQQLKSPSKPYIKPKSNCNSGSSSDTTKGTSLNHSKWPKKGSCNKDEFEYNLERSNSHTSSASENTNEENITSMRNPLLKAPSKPSVKPKSNCDSGSSIDTTKETSRNHSKWPKNEKQRYTPYRQGHKTPMQDRIMKQREELIMKQNLKKRPAPETEESQLIKPDDKQQALRAFKIPKLRNCSSTANQNSEQDPDVARKHPSPLYELPSKRPPHSRQLREPQVPETKNRSPLHNNISSQEPSVASKLPSPHKQLTAKRRPPHSRQPRRPQIPKTKNTSPLANNTTSDEWVHKVWESPPPIVVAATGMPTLASPPVLRNCLATPTSDKVGSSTQTGNSTTSSHPSSFNNSGNQFMTSSPNLPQHVKPIYSDFSFSEKSYERAGTISNQLNNPDNISPQVRSKDFNEESIQRRGGSDRGSTCSSYSSIRKRVNDSDSNFAQETITSKNISPPQLPAGNLTVKKLGSRDSLDKIGKIHLNSDKDSSSSFGFKKKREIDFTNDDLALFKQIKGGSKTKSECSMETSSISASNSANIFKMPTVETAKSPAASTSSISETGKKPLPANPFDARHKLVRRRSMQSTQIEINEPSCSSQDDGVMDWEAIEPKEDVTSCNKHQQPTPASQRSNTSVMRSLPYKQFVVVCDTNILIHHYELVEEMTTKRTLLGIPVKVVVPYQVTKELDNIKTRKTFESTNVMQNENLKQLAREATRLIHSLKNEQRENEGFICNLELQHSSRHRVKADPNLELEKNDDFVLNCALQEKEAAGDEKIVILLTDDKNMDIHASTYSLEVQSGATLKKFVRNVKESVIQQYKGVEGYQVITSNRSYHSDMDMDVDSIDGSSYVSNPLTHATSKSQFHADILNYDLKQYLHNIITAGNERVYQELKKHASQPCKSWSLVTCISNVAKRWATLMEKRLSVSANNNLKQMIELVKKYNKGKEAFEDKDMESYLTCCQNLTTECQDLYGDITDTFRARLNEIIEEWEQRNASRSSSLSPEDDPQPADLALQNIYNCMVSDLASIKNETLQAQDGDKKHLQAPLIDFYQKVLKVVMVLRNAIDNYSQSSLKVTDECIEDFHNTTNVYVVDSGKLMYFDMTKENIVALFKEDNLRKRAVNMLHKMETLQNDVGLLMDELNSDEDF